jgi:hypothetical protein
MESDSEKDAMDWTEAITAHIRYANTVTSADSNNSIISRNSKGNFYFFFLLRILIFFFFLQYSLCSLRSGTH